MGVRVVIPNDQGRLRVGDYAKATIDVPFVDSPNSAGLRSRVGQQVDQSATSARHRRVRRGTARSAESTLVPAAQFGFTDEPNAGGEALVVPRDAVLMAGNNSVVYVETEPGRFEIRRVVLGPSGR